MNWAGVTHCAIDPNLHKVQEFKKPDPVTVTGVFPSKEPKLGKMDKTWDDAPACCVWTDGSTAETMNTTRARRIENIISTIAR